MAIENPIVTKFANYEFEDSKYNFKKEIDPDLSEKDINYMYGRALQSIPHMPGVKREAIKLKINTVHTEPETQERVREFYDDYVKYLTDRGVHVFCTSVQSISSWVRQKIENYASFDWTDEVMKDIDGHELRVGTCEGEKFVDFNFKNNTVFKLRFQQVIYGCNDRVEDESTPVRIVNNSFYNKNNNLIFWFDEEQRKQLEASYKNKKAEDEAWTQWNAVKDQLNEVSFIPIPYLVAEFMLECVPPKRMDKGRWLVGEAYSSNMEGQLTYLECRYKTKDVWEAKLTSVNEYVHGRKEVFVNDRKTAVEVLLTEWNRIRHYETFKAIFLDDKNKLVKLYENTQCNPTKVTYKMSELIRYAKINGATKVITSHNHPSGILLPSVVDRESHKSKKESFAEFGIEFIDDLILHDDGYYSQMDSKINKNVKY